MKIIILLTKRSVELTDIFDKMNTRKGMGLINMKTIALYDKTCSLCKESKRIFQKIDWLNQINWISLQEYEQYNQVKIDSKSLRRELHIITPRGKILKGFYAIRYLFIQFPATALFGFLLYIPFTPIIGEWVYRIIAKNRHRFLKSKCDNGSCSL